MAVDDADGFIHYEVSFCAAAWDVRPGPWYDIGLIHMSLYYVWRGKFKYLILYQERPVED